MQTVSQAWKDAQNKNFLPEAFVDVVMAVGDPESQSDGVPSDNGSEFFSNSSSLTDTKEKRPSKFATCERNLWLLGDNVDVASRDQSREGQGFTGDILCNGDGVFVEKIPAITIKFSRVFTELIPGLTVVWSNMHQEFARKIRVTASAAGTVTYQSVFDNEEVTSILYCDIDNYDTITIEVLEWCLPFRRARIESIVIGIQKTYSKKDIFDFQHSNFVDPLSAELPKNEIVMKIKNLNNEYNPDNPQGAEKYLLERQTLSVTYGYMLNGVKETISAGTFFISEWDTPQNGIEATFTARDALEFMNDKYEGTVTGTLYNIATAALTQANLPTLANGDNRWYVDPGLKRISTPSSVDIDDVSIAEILQYVANAGCCVLYQNREGVIRLEPLPDGETDYEIGPFVSYQNADIKLTKQLKAVNVNNGQYTLTVGQSGETQTINNPLISNAQAPAVAQWAADYLVNRKILSGSFRADPRLDALDRIINKNQFAESVVLVTEVKFTFNGAFRGEYEGRAGV